MKRFLGLVNLSLGQHSLFVHFHFHVLLIVSVLLSESLFVSFSRHHWYAHHRIDLQSIPIPNMKSLKLSSRGGYLKFN